MDNLTHTLVAAAISKTGFNRRVQHASLIVIVAANLPDVDAISLGWGSLAYLEVHRGITHSMVGVTGLGLLLAGAVCLLQRRKWKKNPASGPKPSVLLIGLLCLIGTWSHLLLDFTNSYSVRPFLPFSDRRVSWDIESIFDPVILSIMILGLVIPYLFGMISEEVGETRKYRGRVSAFICLSLLLCLWFVRDLNHRAAVEKLSAFTYLGEDPEGVYALPHSIDPFHWIGVVETSRAYLVLDVRPDFSARSISRARVFYKPEDSDVLQVARKSRVGRVFLEFARMPVYQIESQDEGTVVTIRDIRFYSPTRRRAGFVATIVVSKNLNVVEEEFGFRSRPSRAESLTPGQM